MALQLLLLCFLSPAFAEGLTTVEVNAGPELERLLKQHDKDRDRKITINDHVKGKALSFDLKSVSGETLSVQGVYPLSNLLQELKLAYDEKRSSIKGDRIFENPVKRISRSVRERFWDGLTRRIDKQHLKQVLGDSKVNTGGDRFLYVPHHDPEALTYYREASTQIPELKLKVIRLPKKVTPEYVRDLKNQHGLLALALRKDLSGKPEGVPYVVPGGRFNEMYGWDSFFEALGLIKDGRVDLARAMVDNFVYQITHYGKILNANRTYYLTRSQPPFLTSMIRAVLAKLPDNKETRAWLEISLKAAILEYESVWMGDDRKTSIGLSRYYGNGLGIPPEVEPGHFDYELRPIAKKLNMSVKKFHALYDAGKIKSPELDEFLMHDRCVRESGHDTTYRWRVGTEDKCADFAPVDLNSLLYKFELDLAYLIENNFGGKFQNLKATEFRQAANKRKALMRQYLWDPAAGMFFDYNFKLGKRSKYISATMLYPLWANDPSSPETKILTDEESRQLIKRALLELETKGGLVSTAKSSLHAVGDKSLQRQWEWPNGWAPHQMLAWEGLRNHGHSQVAERLIYKWLYMITRNAMDFNGTIPEKYDVVNRSHAVFAEYGNVGTEFSYITYEGFGWMNASFQVGLSLLSPKSLESLELLTPPEWISFEK